MAYFTPPEGQDYKWYISGIYIYILPIGGWTMPPIPPFRGTSIPTIDFMLIFFGTDVGDMHRKNVEPVVGT